MLFRSITITHVGKPKQETLEEAAERLYQEGLRNDLGLSFHDGVKFGAKWQQEQDKNKYSEEDLIDAFNEGQALNVRGKLIQGKEWFEQFKNK